MHAQHLVVRHMFSDSLSEYFYRAAVGVFERQRLPNILVGHCRIPPLVRFAFPVGLRTGFAFCSGPYHGPKGRETREKREDAAELILKVSRYGDGRSSPLYAEGER